MRVYSSVVVPIDPSGAGDRALAIATSLARRGGLLIELVSVVPPDRYPEAETWRLEERVGRLGVGPHVTTVVRHEHAGTAISEHVGGRDGALLVLATTAQAAVDEDHAGSVSEFVLSTLRQPVLLVGPGVDVGGTPRAPALVVAVDGLGLVAAALPVIESWARTFGGPAPELVEVIPFVPAIASHAGRGLEAARVQACVDRLASIGVTAEGNVVYGDDAATALAARADEVPDAMLVVTAERWPGAGTHWRATSRKLALRSSRPVLVVPSDRDVSSAGAST
jgi:nucleotide-binding universal stress UspA family protein